VVAGRRNGRATRQKVLDAARVAFAAKGYAATSLAADVLEPCGVSVGSFYHQFTGKADLFAAVVTESARAAQRAISEVQREALDLYGVTRSSWARLLDLVDQYEDLFRISLRERGNPDPDVAGPLAEVHAAWADALGSNYREFPGRAPEFPTAAAGTLVTALGAGVIQHYLELAPARRPRERDELLDQLTSFTLGGFMGLTRQAEARGSADGKRASST
jgi:AcrR family transcriptional regulator